MSPLLELVQVLLGGTCPSGTSQLGVACKPAEGALNPTVSVTGKDLKLYWFPVWAPEGHHSNAGKKDNGEKPEVPPQYFCRCCTKVSVETRVVNRV